MDIIATVWKKPYYADRNQRMIDAGVNAFRMKCSGLEIADISLALAAARQQIDASGTPVRLLVDLPEAKIRLGRFPQERLEVEEGEEFRFLFGPESSDPHAYIPFTKEGLARTLNVGDTFYLGDGHLELVITAIHSPNEFIAKSLAHGLFTQATGITIPALMDTLDHVVPEIDQIIAELPKSRPDMVSFSFV